MPLSACISQTTVTFDESRGREANTGWVWGLLGGNWCEKVEGEA